MDPNTSSNTSSSASQSFWLSGDHGPLSIILSYLSPREVATVASVCTSTSPIIHNEYIWNNYWPWKTERTQLKSLLYVPTYKYAIQLQYLYKLPIIHHYPLTYSEDILQEVTCPYYIGNYRIYGYSDGSVRVFGPLDAGSTNRKYELKSGSIRHMQLISKSNKLFVGSWKGAVHSIDLVTGTVKRIVTISPDKLGGEPVYGLRIINDNRLCTCSGDGIVRVFNIQDGSNLGILQGHTGAVTDLVSATVIEEVPLASSPSILPNTSKSTFTRLISTSYDGTLRVWDLRTMTCVATLTGHHGPIWSVAIINNNIIFSSSADGTVRIWYIWDNNTNGNMNCSSSSTTSSTNTNSNDSTSSSSSIFSSKCIHVLSPYSTITHKQIWCIKLIGNRLFMGTSEGNIHCYSIDIDIPNILNKSPITQHLWTYNTGSNHLDGIRRIDIVKEYIYTCTKYGHVGIYNMKYNDTLDIIHPTLENNTNNHNETINDINQTMENLLLSSTSSSNIYSSPKSKAQLEEDNYIPYNFLHHQHTINNYHTESNKTSPTSSNSDIDQDDHHTIDNDWFPNLSSLVRTGTGPCSTHYKSNQVSPNEKETSLSNDNYILNNTPSFPKINSPIISASLLVTPTNVEDISNALNNNADNNNHNSSLSNPTTGNLNL